MALEADVEYMLLGQDRKVEVHEALHHAAHGSGDESRSMIQNLVNQANMVREI